VKMPLKPCLVRLLKHICVYWKTISGKPLNTGFGPIGGGNIKDRLFWKIPDPETKHKNKEGLPEALKIKSGLHKDIRFFYLVD